MRGDDSRIRAVVWELNNSARLSGGKTTLLASLISSSGIEANRTQIEQRGSPQQGGSMTTEKSRLDRNPFAILGATYRPPDPRSTILQSSDHCSRMKRQ